VGFFLFFVFLYRCLSLFSSWGGFSFVYFVGVGVFVLFFFFFFVCLLLFFFFFFFFFVGGFVN